MRLISMICKGRGLQMRGRQLDSELFSDLAHQRPAERFTGLHLPTRKLPEPSMGLSRGSLLHADPLVRTDQAQGNYLYNRQG